MTHDGAKGPDPKKVFDAETECQHGMSAASCAHCRHPDNWLLSRTKKGTLAEVIEQMIVDGRLSADVELWDPGLKKAKHYPFKKLAALAGVAIVGGFVMYKTVRHGPLLGLRIIKAAVDKVAKKKK